MEDDRIEITKADDIKEVNEIIQARLNQLTEYQNAIENIYKDRDTLLTEYQNAIKQIYEDIDALFKHREKLLKEVSDGSRTGKNNIGG